VSRPIGATGVADQGWESRSFSACGAPPGFPPLVCFMANSPMRRDTHFQPHLVRGEVTTTAGRPALITRTSRSPQCARRSAHHPTLAEQPTARQAPPKMSDAVGLRCTTAVPRTHQGESHPATRCSGAPRAIRGLRTTVATTVGPWPHSGATITLVEALRIVVLEATVHLLDVQRALGHPPRRACTSAPGHRAAADRTHARRRAD
jgi:hypothetical protein